MRVFALAVLAMQASAGATATADEAAALLRLTQARYDANARNDRAFYEGLLAANFLLLEPFAFPPWTKSAYLDAEFPAGRSPRPPSRVSEFEARVDGDPAVVRYEVSEPFPLPGDQGFARTSRRLDTYVRRGGAWRLLSMAVAEPPSWPDAVHLDAARLAEYAGVYAIAPGMRVAVTVEGGRLMAEVTGQPKVELFAESATTFFDRTDSPFARTVFERDASGRVVAQVYRSGAQRVVARRLPSP